ncbi:hypothetical protein DFH06DRAFT_1136561 [Mycena polygramma]|nr:hypothetical protein DFH06DRAFT_1136561 [Mycena polygramma]
MSHLATVFLGVSVCPGRSLGQASKKIASNCGSYSNARSLASWNRVGIEGSGFLIGERPSCSSATIRVSQAVGWAIVAVADLAIISVYVVALVKKNDFRWQHILMLVILVLADLIAPLFAGHAWGMHQAQLQAQAQAQGQGPLEAGLLHSPPPEMTSR